MQAGAEGASGHWSCAALVAEGGPRRRGQQRSEGLRHERVDAWISWDPKQILIFFDDVITFFIGLLLGF